MLKRLLFVAGVAAGLVTMGSAAHALSRGPCNLHNLNTRACTSASASATPARGPAARPSEVAPSAPGPKRIVISTASQRLQALEGDRVVLDTATSTGAPGRETPRGTFRIQSKEQMHWSSAFGVWMPKAMRVVGGIFIHELPVTRGGQVIGASTLGQPVSHGCIRLSPSAASFLFGWAQIGTPVTIT